MGRGYTQGRHLLMPHPHPNGQGLGCFDVALEPLPSTLGTNPRVLGVAPRVPGLIPRVLGVIPRYQGWFLGGTTAPRRGGVGSVCPLCSSAHAGPGPDEP